MRIYTKDFNLDPRGLEDSTFGFIDLINHIKEVSKNNEYIDLYVDKGDYVLSKENGQERHLYLSNTDSLDYPVKAIGLFLDHINNLTIHGNGSKLIIYGDMMAMAIVNCKNVIIRDLTVTYKSPTSTEMKLIDYQGNSYKGLFKITNAFDYIINHNDLIWLSDRDSHGRYYWMEKNAHKNYGIYVRYPQYGMTKIYDSQYSPFENVKNIREIKRGLVEISYQVKPKIKLSKGMIFQFTSNVYRKTAGAFIEHSSNIRCENINFNYLPGFGFLVQMCENVSFRGCNFIGNKERELNVSSAADGIHVSGAKGMVEILDCRFDNCLDDPINIHGTYTVVEEIIDNHTLILSYKHRQQGGFTQYYKGDKLVFYDANSLKEKFSGREYIVKDYSIPYGDNFQQMKVTLQDNIPDQLRKLRLKGSIVCENRSYNPEVHIRGNSFTNTATRCLLVTSGKEILIEDNIFDKPSMAALYVSSDAKTWFESSNVKKIIIRNNIFINNSLDDNSGAYLPCIYFDPQVDLDSNYYVHENIVIENNKFILEKGGALKASHVNHLRFRENNVIKKENNYSDTLNFYKCSNIDTDYNN